MASRPATDIATIHTPDVERFNLMQREAKIFAYSPLIPEHLRKGGEQQAIANCYIALKLARTMGEDPLVVLQNIHIVSGKAGFSAQYMIARANAAGIFKGRIDWRIARDDRNNLAVTAYAILKDTGQEVSVTCDMAMAKAEGWTKNPKYTSMPEVMLRYRSATFLVRFYAPDVMLGYHTSEEIEDVAIARGPDLSATPLTGAMLIDQAAGQIVDAETGEAEPEVRADADHGDQHDGTNELPAWHDRVETIRANLAGSKTPTEVNNVESEFLLISAGLPDDVAQDIEAAIVARRKEVR